MDRAQMWHSRRVALWAARALLLSVLLGVLLVVPPEGTVGVALPLVIEIVAAVIIAVVAARSPAGSRAIWSCVAATVALTAVGDLLYSYQQHSLGEVPFPGWADPVYLAAYLPEFAAMALLVHHRLPAANLDERLDTAIITVPIVTATVVWVIQPLVLGLSWSGVTLLAVAYPLLDVLVLSALIRLAVGGGYRNRSLGLLTASVSVTLVADLVFNAFAARSAVEQAPGWLQVLFTMGVMLMTAAALSSDALDIDRARGTVDERPIATGRTIALAVGSLALPLIAVFALGVSTTLDFRLLAAGAVAANVLIGIRAARLMRVVNAQRDQLSETARTDALTGLPNRRSWDHEIDRMQSWVGSGGRGVTVALLDLDHFKRYNDTFGHQAGDRLLTACARAWREALPPTGYIARYGGEEFAVLLPGATTASAQHALELLRVATPEATTVSIGHAAYRPGARLTDIFGDADAALYAAKSRGRNVVVGISVTVPDARGRMHIVG